MSHVPYRGSGPYCYANSLAMMMGAAAPDPMVIETVTGSPFGMQLVGGALPFFDPYGQPGMTGPIGADHYLIAVGVERDHITVHDPQGYPYARLPLPDFTAALRADTLTYGQPYTTRTDFTRTARVSLDAALIAVLPRAVAWLDAEPGHPMPAGSLANGHAALALADLLAADDEEVREHLVHFAVRVGARRLTDAATCLHRAGITDAAATMDRQARLVGALQHCVSTGDTGAAVQTLRALAPTYDNLRTDLERSL